MAEEERLIDPAGQTTFGKVSSGRNNKLPKVVLAILIVVLAAAVLAVFFIGGFVAGKKQAGSSAAPGTTGFNWGADVKVDGKEMPVVDWLSENMAANNIKNNLL